MNPGIIIPTYTNTFGLLKLLKQLADYEEQIIVVDNKPSGKKQQSIKPIKYLAQEKNLGFAKGVNEGVKHTTSEWIAILNDDIILLAKDTLSQLVSYAEKNNWDAVSPVLKKPDGTVENYGYAVLPIGRVKLNMENCRLDSSYLDGITAACLVMKRSVFEKMRGFDESFFAYLEDVDLFLRIKRAGYRFGICKDISVIHEHMSTSGKMGWFKEKQNLINWIRVIAKNWGWKKILMNLPGIFIERLRNINGLIKKMRVNS